MIQLFFSYSHVDEHYRNELEKHLSVLKRNGLITAWHDRRITAGSEFDKEISEYLKQSNIILLLISADFLASDYCYEKEMSYALKMHEQGKAVVIPVILRPCSWKDTPVGKLIAIPKDGKPVVKYASLDEAFAEITEEIKRVIQAKFSQQKSSDNQPRPSTPDAIPKAPRSSNLRITKSFSDHDKDKFLDDAFEYISNYFENSLQELEQRNPEISSRFIKIDAQSFSANIYVNGSKKCECMIFYGNNSMFTKSISYSNHISNNRNSLNESLHVSDNGYSLFLTLMGMSSWGSNAGKELTFEGAAEYYWELFIKSLQSNNRY